MLGLGVRVGVRGYGYWLGVGVGVKVRGYG